MGLTITTSGSQTAVVNTEHTLATGLAALKTYTLTVDLVNMTWGDVVELRIKKKVLTGGTERILYLATWAHTQDTAIKDSPPFPAPWGATVTLKQIAGTARVFPWEITTPD